jgi:N-acetylglucosaminylphosphatidylinositol deacetylase
MMQLLTKPAQILGRVPRRAWRWILRAAVVVLVIPVLLQWVVAYVVGGDARILPPQLLAARNLLIVTAHPDDECLFFSPSILGVLDRNRGITGGLLVMSTGELVLDYYGLGLLTPG